MIKYKIYSRAKGLTLIEILAVIGLIALMAGGTMISYSAVWGNLKFKRQAQELVNAFQMARNGAATSNRRYQICLNRTEQGYVFREYTETQIVYDEEIFQNALAGVYGDSLIEVKYFSKHMILENVEYDYYTKEELALDLESQDVYHFIAGRSGWLCGGRILLLDADGQPWTIVIHRLGKPAELFEGDVGFLLPQDDVPF